MRCGRTRHFFYENTNKLNDGGGPFSGLRIHSSCEADDDLATADNTRITNIVHCFSGRLLFSGSCPSASNRSLGRPFVFHSEGCRQNGPEPGESKELCRLINLPLLAAAVTAAALLCSRCLFVTDFFVKMPCSTQDMHRSGGPAR